MFLGKFVFSFLLLFAFASSSFAAPAESSRSIASISAASDVEAQEIELVSEIDRQSDVIFKDFVANSGSRVPFSILKKAQRLAVYRLRQMHVLTDILKASGPAPATTILATELLADLILAPLATAFGKPAVAGVMVSVPWGVVAGFGVFTYQVMKARFKLARSLGVKSLKSLDALRAIVIGYDLKYRVSSVIYQSLSSDMGEVEFEVLRKGWKFETAKMPGIRISELESLVRSAWDGPAYLQEIYLERLDPSFYSSLLLRFINESETMTAELINLVRARLPAVAASDDPLSLRRHLLGIDDVQMQLDREIKNSQTLKAGLKKRVKKGELTSYEAKRLKVHAIKEIERLQAVHQRLMRHEYSVLLEAQARLANETDLTPRTVLVPSSRASDLVEIALEAHLHPSKAGVIAAANSRVTTVDRVKAVVRALSARPLVCQDLFL